MLKPKLARLVFIHASGPLLTSWTDCLAFTWAAIISSFTLALVIFEEMLSLLSRSAPIIQLLGIETELVLFNGKIRFNLCIASPASAPQVHTPKVNDGLLLSLFTNSRTGSGTPHA